MFFTTAATETQLFINIIYIQQLPLMLLHRKKERDRSITPSLRLFPPTIPPSLPLPTRLQRRVTEATQWHTTWHPRWHGVSHILVPIIRMWIHPHKVMYTHRHPYTCTYTHLDLEASPEIHKHVLLCTILHTNVSICTQKHISSHAYRNGTQTHSDCSSTTVGLQWSYSDANEVWEEGWEEEGKTNEVCWWVESKKKNHEGWRKDLVK